MKFPRTDLWILKHPKKFSASRSKTVSDLVYVTVCVCVCVFWVDVSTEAEIHTAGGPDKCNLSPDGTLVSGDDPGRRSRTNFYRGGCSFENGQTEKCFFFLKKTTERPTGDTLWRRTIDSISVFFRQCLKIQRERDVFWSV